MSYSFAAAALNPRTHYTYDTTTSVMKDLREAFEYMANTDTCVTALQQADHYRRKQCTFSSKLAQKMTYNSNISPGMFINLSLNYWLLIDEGSSFFHLLHLAAQWWAMFGIDTSSLQGITLRLISQCSSSGCERNWSTFALIHTKVHNRLSSRSYTSWSMLSTTSASACDKPVCTREKQICLTSYRSCLFMIHKI
jgi:hypothetical protein